jgi:hypothetical protein
MRKISFLFYQCSYKLMQLLHIYLFISLSLSIEQAFVCVIPESVNKYVCISAAHTYIMLFLVSKLRLGGKGLTAQVIVHLTFLLTNYFLIFPGLELLFYSPQDSIPPPPPRGRGTGGAGVGGRSLGQCIKSLAWRLRID